MESAGIVRVDKFDPTNLLTTFGLKELYTRTLLIPVTGGSASTITTTGLAAGSATAAGETLITVLEVKATGFLFATNTIEHERRPTQSQQRSPIYSTLSTLTILPYCSSRMMGGWYLSLRTSTTHGGFIGQKYPSRSTT